MVGATQHHRMTLNNLSETTAELEGIVKGKSVLVTGGAGAIGTILTNVLCKENRVTVIDNLSSGYLENIPSHSNVTFINSDILHDEVLNGVFRDPFDCVFHLAANFANQNSVDHPQKDLAVNGLGFLKILSYGQKGAWKRLVYASSSCVYGQQETAAVETGPLSPDTPYAITKRLGEDYAAFFRSHHGLAVTTLRYFNSYGPGDRPGRYRSVVPNMFSRAFSGLPLQIYGTGDETRDFTFVTDIVQGTLLAAVRDEAVGETFNIASGEETTIGQLVKAVNELSGNKAPIEMLPRRTWDHVTRRRADISKAIFKLGYRPEWRIERGLQATCDWLRSAILPPDYPTRSSGPYERPTTVTAGR